MLFTSIDFLIFFTATLAWVIAARDSRTRFWILLIASYIFYAAWDWRFVPLLLAVSLWNWWLAIQIERQSTAGRRKLVLWAAVLLNIGALGYFKYANFFLNSLSAVTGGAAPHLDIILPLGISFFTFQGVSYVVDVYRKRHPPTHDLLTFLFFKAFFPQLIAGPIVRAVEMMPQLLRPFRFRREMVVMGGQYFVAGATAKLVFADNLAVCADRVFQDPALYDAPTLWLGLLSYSGQIYCDFFGYSTMAIGLARIFGYRLPVNFRMPYTSLSIQEFWRRWHITLSNWLRDYLYISLGGNRRGEARTLVNLLVTMLIGGLWHGASWNFVLWGGMHGGALILNRLLPKPLLGGSVLGGMLGWALTFLFVILAWVPFRAPDFGTTALYMQGLFGLGEGKASWPYLPSLILLGVLVAWHAAYLTRSRWAKGKLGFRYWTRPVAVTTNLAALGAITLYAPLGATPFIYFQF